jgi:hypothetical protein
MAASETHSKTEALAFVAEFGHLPNVRRAVALAEAGTLRWADVARVFRDSLAEGLRSVS